MQHPESTYRLRQNLPKTERLCSEKIIARLFQSGVFVSKYPLRLNAVVDNGESLQGTWMLDVAELPAQFGVRVLFSASKRRFPRAVDRNRVKRLLREVYRKNKQDLWAWAQFNQKQLSIAMIYTGKEIVDYQRIEQLWKDLQVRLVKKLSLPEVETPTKSST